MSKTTERRTISTWLTAGIGLSIALLAGRIIGLVRELLIAGQFGATRTADQLILLLTFPDIMTGLLTTGAMLYVLVPEFRRSDDDRSRGLFVRISLLVAGTLGALMLVISLLLPRAFLTLFAPGFSSPSIEAIVPYLPLFALMAPLTGLASVSTALLQSKERFILPALGTVMLNTVIVGGLLIAGASGRPFLVVGLAVVAGGLMRYGSQLAALRTSIGGSFTTAGNVGRDLAVRYGTALLAGGLFLLFPVFARAFASDTTGGIALFNYSVKLADLPLGIAITVLPVLLLPRMTDAIDEDAPEGARRLSRASVYATLALALAIGLPGFWFADTIVAILYGWTGLDTTALDGIAGLVAIAFLAIPAQGAIAHSMTVLNAARQPAVVLLISFVSLGVFTGLAWVLRPYLGLNGVMIALAGGYYSGWMLFAVWGARALSWRMGDLGLSTDTLILIGINIIAGAAVAGLTMILPGSILMDIILGVLWFGVSLLLSLHVHRTCLAVG